MCVLAAYLGDRPAAEILLGMIERMEGLTCGHYSGLATVSEGKIHAARCVGSVATLRRETDAERLPGTCGIAHVRPALGGGREWAHPFVSGDRRFALAVNGHAGFFDRPGRLEERTCLLEGEGYVFRPLFPEPGDVATVLPRSAAEAIVAARLTDGSQPTVQDLKDATAHLWPEETAPQKDFLVYDILRELNAADRLRHIDRTVAGSVPGETATETHFERV